MTLPIHQWSGLDDESRNMLLRRTAAGADSDVRSASATIVAAVKDQRDAALVRFTNRFDSADLMDFRVTADEFQAADATLSTAQREAIDLSIRNVRRFHDAQKPTPIRVETMPGVVCERLTHAIDAVGLYVPAGTAPLPSAAIMLAVPAKIAGCPRIALCTPPRPGGNADPAVLVAAKRAGVEEIYKVGGAQAIAAMAYGTETIPQVSKIFGPGNAWVTAAKQLVSVDADGAAIDLPAGPSELLIIADSDASAEFVAADLLSQAEHGSDSQLILVTTSESLASAVQANIDTQLTTLTRATIARDALANSMIIIVNDIDTAIVVSNRYAPEHLILQVENARSWLGDVRNAGSVFLGPWAPESVGDYCSGTNHVLPTYGYAKNYSGLGVEQFMRHMTVQELTLDGLRDIGDAVTCLARLEGLDAHAAAVTRRLETDF